MATLSHISVHPIKALDPADPDRVSITPVGGLEKDRAYAIVDAEGEYVNGKRTAAVHRLDAAFDLEAGVVELGSRETEASRTFHLDDDRRALEAWLSDALGLEVHLEVKQGGFQTDSVIFGDESQAGPTLISEATLREAASWYEGIDLAEMRLRLRPNLVVEGVPAFWEDKLFSDGGRRIQIGDVTLEGVKPLPRCVVPTRHPQTGEVHEGFRETFLEKREATLPDWVDRAPFEGNLYRMMVATRFPASERDGELAVGDSVRLLDFPAES